MERKICVVAVQGRLEQRTDMLVEIRHLSTSRGTLVSGLLGRVSIGKSGSVRGSFLSAHPFWPKISVKGSHCRVQNQMTIAARTEVFLDLRLHRRRESSF